MLSQRKGILYNSTLCMVSIVVKGMLRDGNYRKDILLRLARCITSKIEKGVLGNETRLCVN